MTGLAGGNVALAAALIAAKANLNAQDVKGMAARAERGGSAG
jgi:hypothetical protein